MKRTKRVMTTAVFTALAISVLATSVEACTRCGHFRPCRIVKQTPVRIIEKPVVVEKKVPYPVEKPVAVPQQQIFFNNAYPAAQAAATVYGDQPAARSLISARTPLDAGLYLRYSSDLHQQMVAAARSGDEILTDSIRSIVQGDQRLAEMQVRLAAIETAFDTEPGSRARSSRSFVVDVTNGEVSVRALDVEANAQVQASASSGTAGQGSTDFEYSSGGGQEPASVPSPVTGNSPSGARAADTSLIVQHCSRCHTGANPANGLVLDGESPVSAETLKAVRVAVLGDPRTGKKLSMPKDKDIDDITRCGVIAEFVDLLK